MMANEMTEVPEVQPETYATFDRRFCARMIDLAVLVLLGVPLWGVYYLILQFSDPPPAVLLVWPFLGLPVYVVYFAVMTARSGQTLGKRYVGIQVQGEDGRPPRAAASVWRASLDAACYVLLAVVVGFADYLWVYTRKDRRALHDLAAGTCVKVVRPWPKHVNVVLLFAFLVALSSSTPRSLVTTRGHQDVDNMSPVIRKGEWWEANGLAYRHRSPKLGDVVAFREPLLIEGYVGRVVGLPGERLALRNGAIERVTVPLSSPLAPGWVWVPYSCVAVLGDNRGTPEGGGYPRVLHGWPFPLPPGGRPGRDYPMSSPQQPGPNNSDSPILMVPLASVTGKVMVVTMPFWRLRTVQ